MTSPLLALAIDLSKKVDFLKIKKALFKSFWMIMALASSSSSSYAMLSIFGSPVQSRLSSPRITKQLFITANYLPRNGGMRISCMANQDDESASITTSSPSLDISPPAAPAPKPKVSTKFSDVLAFGGPAPERINGRLAMIGFVAAIGVELSKGQDLLAQISNGGIPWFVGTSIVLSLASLIPLFQGVSVESKSEGLMTSDAELWNGRFAMLGLLALAFTEYVKGGTLV